MHEKHIIYLTNTIVHIDTHVSNSCLTHDSIFDGAEGYMTVNRIGTRNYLKYIDKGQTINTDKCRLCHRLTETMDQIRNEHKMLITNDLIHKHNTEEEKQYITR